MKYFIVSFDGGGARLLLQWTLFKRIMQRFPQVLGADIYAGTSAGSIIAAAIASGKGALADSIFTVESMRQVFECSVGQKVRSLGGLLSSKYRTRGLRQLLEDNFGSLTLQDVPRSLFIPAFRVSSPHCDIDHDHDNTNHDNNNDNENGKSEECEMDAASSNDTGPRKPAWLKNRCQRWHPVYHENISDSIENQDKLVVEAILQSSAAPYYFPTVKGEIDGGVFCNNPSLAILCHLMSLGIELQDINILSIGSGEKPYHLDIKNAEWGLLQWAPHLLEVIFDSNQEATAQHCWQLLGDRFHRVFPLLAEEIALDGVDQVEEMIRVGEAFDLEPTFEWLQQTLGGDE